jgi:hypothetical protein
VKANFWSRNKANKKVKISTRHASSLKGACNELGRPDLYAALSSVLILNPRLAEQKLELVLKAARFRTAAGVMLYRSRDAEAEKYFKMALNSVKGGSVRYRRLQTVLSNFPTVAKIARRTWMKSGKYAKEEARKISWRR